MNKLSDEERLARLRLFRSETVGPITFYRLLSRFGNAVKALEMLPVLAKRGGRTTKIHMVAANDRCALTFSLSPGQAHDGVEGRKLLSGWRNPPQNIPLTMDRAYEGDETRQLVLDL